MSGVPEQFCDSKSVCWLGYDTWKMMTWTQTSLVKSTQKNRNPILKNTSNCIFSLTHGQTRGSLGVTVGSEISCLACTERPLKYDLYLPAEDLCSTRHNREYIRNSNKKKRSIKGSSSVLMRIELLWGKKTTTFVLELWRSISAVIAVLMLLSPKQSCKSQFLELCI